MKREGGGEGGGGATFGCGGKKNRKKKGAKKGQGSHYADTRLDHEEWGTKGHDAN